MNIEEMKNASIADFTEIWPAIKELSQKELEELKDDVERSCYTTQPLSHLGCILADKFPAERERFRDTVFTIGDTQEEFTCMQHWITEFGVEPEALVLLECKTEEELRQKVSEGSDTESVY